LSSGQILRVGWAVKLKERSSPYNRSADEPFEVTLTDSKNEVNSGFIVKPSLLITISSGNM